MMVFTLLHFPQAYITYKILSNKTSYPGLLIGSLLPDLEIPILYLITHNIYYSRLILHSFIGAITFSWIIGLLILPTYKSVLKKLTKTRIEIEIKPYTCSIIIGSILHVLLDGMHHIYNPLLWPITSKNITTLIIFEQELMQTSLHIIFLILTILCTIDIFHHKPNNFSQLIYKLLYNPQ